MLKEKRKGEKNSDDITYLFRACVLRFDDDDSEDADQISIVDYYGGGDSHAVFHSRSFF